MPDNAPDAEWLNVDGSYIQRDPQTDHYVATLIIHPRAFDDMARLRALVALMDCVAPILPKKEGPTDEIPHS
jgi:hypothetical protein